MHRPLPSAASGRQEQPHARSASPSPSPALDQPEPAADLGVLLVASQCVVGPRAFVPLSSGRAGGAVWALVWSQLATMPFGSRRRWARIPCGTRDSAVGATGIEPVASAVWGRNEDLDTTGESAESPGSSTDSACPRLASSMVVFCCLTDTLTDTASGGRYWDRTSVILGIGLTDAGEVVTIGVQRHQTGGYQDHGQPARRSIETDSRTRFRDPSSAGCATVGNCRNSSWRVICASSPRSDIGQWREMLSDDRSPGVPRRRSGGVREGWRQ